MKNDRRIKPIPGGKVRFIENEPRKKVPGGATRTSARVSYSTHPAIKRRLELSAILGNVCPGPPIGELLKPGDEAILQRIAYETEACGTGVMPRRKAIGALRHFPTAETIDILTDLAELGDDVYVRACAIETLGSMKVRTAWPIFVKGLRDSSDLVVNAATLAVDRAIDFYGEEYVAGMARREKSGKTKDAILNIIKTRHEKPKKMKIRSATPD